MPEILPIGRKTTYHNQILLPFTSMESLEQTQAFILLNIIANLGTEFTVSPCRLFDVCCQIFVSNKVCTIFFVGETLGYTDTA